MISVISRISVGLRQASAAIGSYIIQTTIHHLFHQIIPPLCFRSSKRLHFEKRLIIKGCRTCPATGSIFSIAEILLEAEQCTHQEIMFGNVTLYRRSRKYERPFCRYNRVRISLRNNSIVLIRTANNHGS